MSEAQSFVKLCGQCGQPMIEIARNEYYVFYKCGCNMNKSAAWDWKTALIDGVELELGSAGSFVCQCPNCKAIIFRQRITNEICLHCGKDRIKPKQFRTVEIQD